MKVHEAIARALADAGVDTLFGLIGDANLYMVDSFVRDCGGKYVRSVHEAGAVLMALGHAQASGRIGVATVTHGPALTNTATALVEGAKAAIPMVLLAGDTPMQDREHPQSINQREFVAATGAGFEPLRAPHTVAEDVNRAFRRAMDERRPIVLNMPIEFQWQDTEYRKLELNFPEVRRAATSGPDMDAAIGILYSARRPVVVAGRGAIDPQSRAALLRFAERIEAPLSTTLRGKGLFSGEPFDLGICGTVSSPVANDAILGSDCLIVFGASLNKFTTGMGGLTRDKRIIQVNPLPGQLSCYTPVDAELVGDPGLIADAMVALLDEAEVPGSGARTADLRKAIAEYQGAAVGTGTRTPGTVDLVELLQSVNASVPDDRVFATDGGRFATTTWPEVAVKRPQDFVNTTGFMSIGLGLGEAIGASVAAEGRTTLLVAGDGGLMLSGLSELTTAVREQLDLVVVVCNDGSYGAEHQHFKNRNMDASLSLLEWPDFAPVAQALGAEALTVRSSADLHAAMAALAKRDRKRPFLIDAKLDPASIRDY